MANKVYDIITEQILEALDRDEVPWQKPWDPAVGMPRNLRGTHYRGLNVWWLAFQAMERGYKSPVWLTYNQAKKLGAQVRKGESGTKVIFWKWMERTNEDGETEGFPLLRYYTVFNAEQVDGLELDELEDADAYELPEIDELLDNMPDAPDVRFNGGKASYFPGMDFVGMPPRVAFDCPEMYFKTLAHELVHATGHPKRLDRFSENADQFTFASESYSEEELVAEMGAAMLCALSGVEGTFDNSVAYIQHWRQKLADNSRLIINAASRAQKAVDYIMGRTWDDNQ